MKHDTLTFYKQRSLTGRKRQWRWRYQAAGNAAKLANGGESYYRLSDAMMAAFRVCDVIEAPLTMDASGRLFRRRDGSSLEIAFKL